MTNRIAAAAAPLAFELIAGRAQSNAGSITAAEVANHVGEATNACGLVANAKYATAARRRPTSVNRNRAFPNQVSTTLIWGPTDPSSRTRPRASRAIAFA